MSTPSLTYQVDSKWRLERASDEFCRAFRCTQAGLIGRDIRELVRRDWHRDFRNYVARALVGCGATEAMVPMMAPSGTVAWYKHSIEPMLEDGVLLGYRATLTPQIVTAAAPARRWWEWRPAALQGRAPKMVWNFDSQPQPLIKAS